MLLHHYKEVFNEIVLAKAYQDYSINVTSYFIVNQVSYDECIKSLKQIVHQKILPEIIDKFI